LNLNFDAFGISTPQKPIKLFSYKTHLFWESRKYERVKTNRIDKSIRSNSNKICFKELSGVFDAILANIENLNNSEKFTNIIQSPLWKNIKNSYFRDDLILPLFIYFDDMEPDNQTGSHVGDHSLGALYY